MAVKTTGVVVNGPSGALHVEFVAAHNAEEVKTFLQANMGKEVEIVLIAREDELRPAGEARSATEGKKLDGGSLSSCASPRYWKGRDEEE